MIIKKEAENDWFKSIKGCPPPEKHISSKGLRGFSFLSKKWSWVYKIHKTSYTSDIKHHIIFGSFMDNNIKKKAFTLAEVLITLGIIGVVAAMTMPSLIQKHKEKEYAAKLIKFNSLMSQALITAVSNEGDVTDWGLTYYTTSDGLSDEELEQANKSRNLFADKVMKYLKVIQYCPYGEGCKTGVTKWDRHSMDGTAFSDFSPYLVLADGTYILGITIMSSECKANRGTSPALQNVCGEIFVDVNGKTPPNATGKDVFLFYYTKFGLIPMGTAEETGFPFDTYCNLDKPGILNGYGCTAWVITHGNMDYLRCNDLSWNGKTKCR